MTIHTIGRLELAITASGDAPSASYVTLLRHFGKNGLPRLIDACLVAERLDEQIVQIDALHIDLGPIDEAGLPQSLITPFMRQFSKALAGIQRASATHGTERPRLDEETRLRASVMDFLRQGLLRGSSDTPDKALNALLDRKPADLTALLDTWLADATIRRRLARQFSRSTQKRILAIARRPSIVGVEHTPALDDAPRAHPIGPRLMVAGKREAPSASDPTAHRVDIGEKGYVAPPSMLGDDPGVARDVDGQPCTIEADHVVEPEPSGVPLGERPWIVDYRPPWTDYRRPSRVDFNTRPSTIDAGEDATQEPPPPSRKPTATGVQSNLKDSARQTMPTDTIRIGKLFAQPAHSTQLVEDDRDIDGREPNRARRLRNEGSKGQACGECVGDAKKAVAAVRAPIQGEPASIVGANTHHSVPSSHQGPHDDESDASGQKDPKLRTASGTAIQIDVPCDYTTNATQSFDDKHDVEGRHRAGPRRVFQESDSHDDVDRYLRVLCGLATPRGVENDDPGRALMVAASAAPETFRRAAYRFERKLLLANALIAHLSSSDLARLASVLAGRTRAAHGWRPVIIRDKPLRTRDDWQALFSDFLWQRPAIMVVRERGPRSKHSKEIAWDFEADWRHTSQVTRRFDHGSVKPGFADEDGRAHRRSDGARLAAEDRREIDRSDRRGSKRRSTIRDRLSRNISILSGAMLETIPIDILQRILADQTRHGSFLSALLRTAEGDPDIAVSTWKATIEILALNTDARQSRRAFLGDLAKHHAALTGMPPASFLVRLRALASDQSLVDTLDRMIGALDRSEAQSRQALHSGRNIKPRTALTRGAADGAIQLVERLVQDLPTSTCHDMIVALAGRHEAVVRARLSTSNLEPFIATSTRQALMIVLAATLPRRSSRRQFVRSIDDQTTAVTSIAIDDDRPRAGRAIKDDDRSSIEWLYRRKTAPSVDEPANAMERAWMPRRHAERDGDRPAAFVNRTHRSIETTSIDNESPTARRSMIAKHAGENASIALASWTRV